MRVSSFSRKQLRFLYKEFGMKKNDIKNLTRKEAFAEYGLVDGLIEMSEQGITEKGRPTKKGAVAGEILDIVVDMKDPHTAVLKVIAGVIILPVIIWGGIFLILKLQEKYNQI